MGFYYLKRNQISDNHKIPACPSDCLVTAGRRQICVPIINSNEAKIINSVLLF